MDRLTGRTALVTGAANGIGAATVRRLAAEGADVLATDLDGDAIDHPVRFALDVSDESSWAAAVAAVRDRFGCLDALVNVAGIVSWDGVEATDRATWDRIVAVNQTGTWFGMKGCLPLLLESEHACIVNTSSILGIVGGGGAAAYQATKGAVRLLTKTAAVEYATRGVRVNCVHPGVITTPMIADVLDAEGDDQRDIQRTPMKRAGTAAEVAAGIAYLVSDDASYVTGAELVIDGGLTAT